MERTSKRPVLQLISKPVVPPFSDGSKCLVRDLCLHLSTVEAHVLTDGSDSPALKDAIVSHAIYGAPGGFSPALQQNLRVFLFLLLRSRAQLWHYVFAPNPRTSAVGHILKALRGIPTVQTVASPPRSFDEPQKLLFGDIVVAQSEWTRRKFLDAYVRSGRSAPRIEVIRPPAPEIAEIDNLAVEKVRARFGLSGGDPLFLYPGDLEVSQGASRIVELSRGLAERLPRARFVIAYRDKTKLAFDRAKELEERVEGGVVRFECNVPDIHALVKASTAVLFPVDDLYGKIDLPIVLLEAFRLGTPVVALNEGPLSSLEGALLLGEDETDWLAAAERLATDDGFHASQCERGLRAIEAHYRPDHVAMAYERLYGDLLSH